MSMTNLLVEKNVFPQVTPKEADAMNDYFNYHLTIIFLVNHLKFFFFYTAANGVDHSANLAPRNESFCFSNLTI